MGSLHEGYSSKHHNTNFAQHFDGDCAGILCKSTVHGDILNSTLTKRALTSKELCGYLTWLCGNCAGAIDSVGRSPLHLAASRGLKDIVEWLIHCKHANIDAKDKESGYTALHRSIFYGQIHVAVHLIKHGANIQIFDRDYLTSIDHAMKDRFSRVVYRANHNCEVYMWGCNSNYTLGLQETKQYPELLSKQNIDLPIKQVCLRKFHCVMVSKDGRVFSCGHGQGGRLGLGETNAAIKPTQVHFKSSRVSTMVCKQVAIGRDHTMFLMDSSIVWMCGLNTHHVLGFSPPPEMLLTPKPLPEFEHSITGICAGCFHSVAWCSTAVYTWGLNAGQLGHDITHGNTLIIPKQVLSLRTPNLLITDVAASDGATVIVVQRGDIYVLHEYQCRKISSRKLNIVIDKVCVIGGHLNEKLDKNLLKEREPLKVLAITNTGNVFLWQESTLQLTRCIFSLNRALNIKDAFLNKSNVLLVTHDGEAFQGFVKERKLKSITDQNKVPTKIKPEFNKFLEKHECEMIVLTRLRNIHRAVSISSDPKGRSFCVLQNDPRVHLQNKIINITKSIMANDLAELLNNTDEMDQIHDVSFKIDTQIFRAHKYIVSSNSKVLADQIKAASLDSEFVEIENVRPDIFWELLQFIYTGSCSLLRSMSCVDSTITFDDDDKNKSAYEIYAKQTKLNSEHKLKDMKNSMRLLRTAAKQLGITEISNYINMNGNSKITNPIREISFDRHAFPEFFDVVIKCNNRHTVQAHKCILAARSDYFNNLFAIRWNENSFRTEVELPCSYKIVEAVVNFLYTDSVQSLENDGDIDHICSVLVVADQLLIQRLKELCEKALTRKLSLRNVSQLIQFAEIYNCTILKQYSKEFICLNLSAILENRTLEILDDSVLEEISSYYWDHNPKLHKRLITPYSNAPTDETVRSVCNVHPINMEVIDAEIDKKALKTNNRRKLRTRKTSQTEVVKTNKTHNDSICSNISETDSLEAQEQEIFQFTDDESLKTDWITVSSPQLKLVQARLRANAQMREETLLNSPSMDYTVLKSITQQNIESPINSPTSSHGTPQWNDSSDLNSHFPQLNSRMKIEKIKDANNSNTILHSIDSVQIKSPPKHEFGKLKIQKLSQKQRKKMVADNLKGVNVSENVTKNIDIPVSRSKQNPWKKIDLIPEKSVDSQIFFPDIIANEQKKRDNFSKMKTKSLLLTQIEDKAIEELKRFYNADDLFEEYLTVQRVDKFDFATPQWVTGKNK